MMVEKKDETPFKDQKPPKPEPRVLKSPSLKKDDPEPPKVIVGTIQPDIKL
jgi:hypothetical protein